MEGAIILALGLATSWLGSNPLFVFGAFNNSLEILASSRKERFHEMGTHQQTCKLSTLTSCRVVDENAEDNYSREDHDTAIDWSDVVGGEEIDLLLYNYGALYKLYKQ